MIILYLYQLLSSPTAARLTAGEAALDNTSPDEFESAGHAQPSSLWHEDFIVGMRCQTYKALKKLMQGHPVLVSHEINFHPLDEISKTITFRKMEKKEFWEKADVDKLTPEILHGTMHFHPVFRLLVRYNWIEPSKKHWIPNMCEYDITDRGKQCFKNAQAWWDSLSLQKKILVQFSE